MSYKVGDKVFRKSRGKWESFPSFVTQVAKATSKQERSRKMPKTQAQLDEEKMLEAKNV